MKKSIQHELNAGLRWCKDAYRKKLEAKFQEFEGRYRSVLIALLPVCDGASGENKVFIYHFKELQFFSTDLLYIK